MGVKMHQLLFGMVDCSFYPRRMDVKFVFTISDAITQTFHGTHNDVIWSIIITRDRACEQRILPNGMSQGGYFEWKPTVTSSTPGVGATIVDQGCLASARRGDEVSITIRPVVVVVAMPQ
jgi:hypothetical protein